MKQVKVAYNLIDGHISTGAGSHAEMLRHAGEWDDNVRAIVFPDKHAVYFRFYSPDYDGVSKPTADELEKSYRAADKAFNALVRNGYCKKSWTPLYWNTGSVVSPLEVRL